MHSYDPIYFAPQRKLGGGWVCFKDSPSPPPAPDYAAAAQATAAGNRDAAIATTEANRVNQYTPYGSLTYQQTGKSESGNPLWSATQTLAPAQQQLLDRQNQTSLGLSELAGQGLGYVKDALGNRISASSLPANMVNPVKPDKTH